MGELRDLREDKRSSSELPPVSARLWNPDFQGKFETPVNEHGLVDLDQLKELGQATVDRSYDWTSRTDVHHLQWPRANYLDDELKNTFRELAWRKVAVPRKFHNWLHRLTVPPELPNEEVMRNAIEAERVAHALAQTAGRAVRLTRIKKIPENALELRLEQTLEEYQRHAEAARKIPGEFQVLQPSDLEVASIEDLLTRNRELGGRAIQFIPIRDAALRRAA